MLDPEKMFETIAGDMNGTVMPGWEPERMAHVRNLKFITPDNFEEAAHLSSDGSFDMYEIMKALYDIGFDGPIRPDHGRMIWDEVAMPGYGLYDRALGAAYLNGLWEAIEKSTKAGK